MAIAVSNVKYIALSVLVEALGTGKDRYVACPVSGYVREIEVVSDVAVDGDNILTCAIAGTAITGGAITLTTSNSVAGTVVAVKPTAAHLVSKGQALKVTSDGGGAVGQCRVTFLIEQL